MEPLNYAFPFVRDVHVKIKILINKKRGIAKLRQDYYLKSAHNKYLLSQNENDKI